MKASKKRLPAKTALASTVCVLAMSAAAQDADVNLEEVLVIGSYQKSLDAAMAVKREQTKITDAISAEDLGSFPSENIAEAIQRIPGVQISNVNGRGATISVRGLGPQYSRTTLNGQSFKGADFTTGFRFDIIQTELASGIQVSKSPSADMDAGGLSGTINIDTAKPLNFDERKLLISAKGQKSEYTPTGDITPKLNATYIDQFADNTLGVMLNIGHQELDDRVDNFWMDRWDGGAEGVLTPRRPRFRRIDRETNRDMYNGTVQWQPNDALDVSLTAVYASDEVDQTLDQQVFLFKSGGGIIAPDESSFADGGYSIVNVVDTHLENNRQLESQQLHSQAYTADITWVGDLWTLSGVLHYTKGEADGSERAAILGVIVPQITFDLSDRNNVILDTHGTDLADATLYNPDTMFRNEYPNGATRFMTSDETAVQFDVTRDLEGGFFTSVSAGVKYRQETFDRRVHRRDRAPYGEADYANLPLMSETSTSVNGFLDGAMSIPHAWVAPDIEAYEAALVAEGFTVPILFAGQSSYSLDRDIFSAYAMATFKQEFGDMVLRGDFGARYEATDRTLKGYYTEANPENEEINIVTGEYRAPYDYDNLLPSVNVVLEVTDEVQLRFAAAKVLVRPIITSRTQLAPTQESSLNNQGTTTYSVNLGQPEMKAMTADQLDAGVEWYYGEGAGLTLNLFSKKVENGTISEMVCPGAYDGIALSSSGSDCVDDAGNIYEIQSTYNDSEKLDLNGYELGWNQSLDGLLPLDGFGITANYTHINVDDREGSELANSSKETYNVTGYWDNGVFSARASVNHRSPYIQSSSADSFFSRQGRTVDDRDQIDIALGWQVNDNFNLSAGMLNINGNDEEAYKDIDSRWQTTTVLGTNYYLGVTYQM